VKSVRTRLATAALALGAALATWGVMHHRDRTHTPSPAELNRMQQSKPPLTTAPTAP